MIGLPDDPSTLPRAMELPPLVRGLQDEFADTAH